MNGKEKNIVAKPWWENPVFLLTLGAILGVLGTLATQWITSENINKTLHRKLFQEIVSNQKQAMIMEVGGKFKTFETTAWDNFVGTPAFYQVPMDIRISLDGYYALLKGYNKDIFKWKALDDKKEWEMKTADMNELPEDYIKFLVDKKILSPNDAKHDKYFYSKNEKDIDIKDIKGKTLVPLK